MIYLIFVLIARTRGEKVMGEKYRMTHFIQIYNFKGYFRYFSIAALNAKIFSHGTFKILWLGPAKYPPP